MLVNIALLDIAFDEKYNPRRRKFNLEILVNRQKIDFIKPQFQILIARMVSIVIQTVLIQWKFLFTLVFL